MQSAEELIASKAEELKWIRTHLNSCVRCAMRHLGVRDPAAYQLPLSKLSEAVSANKDGSEDVCPVCLGCLEHCVDDNGVKGILSTIHASEHELRSFSLSLTLPVNVLVRERSAWLHLRRSRAADVAVAGGGFCLIGSRHEGDEDATSRGPPFEHVVDLKEVLRWVLSEP